MRLETAERQVPVNKDETLAGYDDNGLFCWVCGKRGEGMAVITCHNHPEGPVQWAKLTRKPQKPNTVVMFYGVVIPLTEHAPGRIGSPGLCMKDGFILTDA